MIEEAAKASYSNQEGWKQFILNGTTTGADVVAADGDDSVICVYDLNGVLRMTTTSRGDISALPAGLYIVNGVKTIIK